jgi:hypothetical protein
MVLCILYRKGWLAFQNLTYLKLGSNGLKLYRIVNNNGFSKLSTFRAAQKAPVAAVVIQSCHWNHVGKLLFHKISTILFVAVPLIFIYIQVSDSGSQEPLVNISVIVTYNLEHFILFSCYNSRPYKMKLIKLL